MRINKVTTRALLRRGRPELAFVRTRRTIVSSWNDWRFQGDDFVVGKVKSPDINFAVKESIYFDDAWGTTSRKARLTIAAKDEKTIFKRLRNALYWELQASGWGAGVAVPPDPVVATVLGDGREVFLHTYLHRTLQRTCLLSLQPQLERIFLDGTHAYRPKRSRYTALAQARQHVRDGCHYVTSGDVKNFFPSIGTDLLEKVVRIGFPWIGADLRGLLLWTCCPSVLYRPSHPRRSKGSMSGFSSSKLLGHLVAGSVLGPTLANMVGHELLDVPLARLMPEVRMIRYADDMYFFSRTPGDAEGARELVERLLDDPGLKIHPDKGNEVAIDLRRERIRFLGKDLHGCQVVTPDEVIDRHIDRIVSSQIGSWHFRSAIGSALADLCLDRRQRLQHLRRLLKRCSRPDGLWFDQQAATAVGLPAQDDPEDLHSEALNRAIEAEDEEAEMEFPATHHNNNERKER